MIALLSLVYSSSHFHSHLSFFLSPSLLSLSLSLKMQHDPYHPRHYSDRSKRSSNKLASCIVATVFVLVVLTAAVTVFFVFFKPKPPKISVDAVQFPSFSAVNGTFSLTFFQLLHVSNPNRDSFSHFDSSLQLVYKGNQVGVVFIPAGQIGGGQTQKMSAKFEVKQYPLAAGGAVPVAVDGGGGDFVGFQGTMMEIETRMDLVGRVRVLRVFTHRVESGVKCSVAIQVSTGSVLGVHC